MLYEKLYAKFSSPTLINDFFKICKNTWASTQENLILLYVNNKGADPRSLISAFVICSLYLLA